jgi:probable phosphoglycerate mutase
MQGEKTSMPTAWFIRHAESEANVGLPTTSPANVKLTNWGRKQAEYIARAFTNQPDIIVTSPYIRTKQTAIPTIERFPNSSQQEWPVQEFTYLSPSQCHGSTIEERRPLTHKYWQHMDPFYVDGEGAESFAQFIHRVQNILVHLNTYENEFIAIFSHEQFIRAVLWTLWLGDEQNVESNLNPAGMQHFRQFLTAFSMPNGSMIQLIWTSGEMPQPGKILTAHLPEWKEEAPGAVAWLQHITAGLAQPRPRRTYLSV